MVMILIAAKMSNKYCAAKTVWLEPENTQIRTSHISPRLTEENLLFRGTDVLEMFIY